MFTLIVQLKIDLQAHFPEELHPIKAKRTGIKKAVSNVR